MLFRSAALMYGQPPVTPWSLWSQVSAPPPRRMSSSSGLWLATQGLGIRQEYKEMHGERTVGQQRVTTQRTTKREEALLYPFFCGWTFRLLPCLGYCKQHCNEHRGGCMYPFGPCLSSDICPGVGLKDHMVALFLVF